MSLLARKLVADAVVVRNASDRTDLLDPKLTNTALIALLIDVVAAAKSLGKWVLLTSVRTDHGFDGYLGPHSHQNGFAVDGWLLNVKQDGDYVDPTDPVFADWLNRVLGSPWCFSIGLAGSANTPANRAAVAPLGFRDEGADHVHLAAQIE